MTNKHKKAYIKFNGQSLPEWGLIIALISVICTFSLSYVASSVNSTTAKINKALNTVNTTTSTTT